MILSDLKHYLQTKKRVTLNELVVHFKVEPDALRGMIGQWQRKGKVRLLPVSRGCGSSCHKCDPSLTEFYEWVG